MWDGLAYCGCCHEGQAFLVHIRKQKDQISKQFPPEFLFQFVPQVTWLKSLKWFSSVNACDLRFTSCSWPWCFITIKTLIKTNRDFGYLYSILSSKSQDSLQAVGVRIGNDRLSETEVVAENKKNCFPGTAGHKQRCTSLNQTKLPTLDMKFHPYMRLCWQLVAIGNRRMSFL